MSQPASGFTDLRASLALLADGIIPADARDSGAASVDAAGRLAEKIAAGVNQSLYKSGLGAAVESAQSRFGKPLTALDSGEAHDLLGFLRDSQPAFFRQLRMDVCSLYLSDPGVWSRIGFPGPSTAEGGYPDFDQPQA
jgi:hypothetical protein